jgi:glycine betaine catabolism B
MASAPRPAQAVRLVSSAIDPGCVGTFRFDKPAGYSFSPGQFMSLTVDTRDGPLGHHFSHADAPGDALIEITTRMTGSAFKDALGAMRPGDSASLDGPKGRFTVSPGARVVFLAGGVGITPVRSILRDADQRGEAGHAVLLYGNQTAGCVPYGEEMHALAARRPGLEVVDVLAEPDADWAGERGFITPELVRSYVDPDAGWHFMIVGPPAMLEPMRAVIAELGVPAERSTFESFSGYPATGEPAQVE